MKYLYYVFFAYTYINYRCFAGVENQIVVMWMCYFLYHYHRQINTNASSLRLWIRARCGKCRRSI